MFKKLSILVAIFFSINVFSLPIMNVKGSFRSSRHMDKIFFVSSEEQNFTAQEAILADKWLKKRLKGTKYNYSDLTISFNTFSDVRQVVKGCFYSWFKKLEINTRLNLMEYLKPNGVYTLSQEEINHMSSDLDAFTYENSSTCKNDNILGDITTTFITIELEQYLTDKSNNTDFNIRYNDIFEKVFDNQIKKLGFDELGNFLNWLDNTQIKYPYLTTDILNNYVNNIARAKQKHFSESESSFLLVEAINSNVEEFKNNLSDHIKMIPYIKSSRLIYEKCFFNSEFLENKCNFDNIGNNFYIVKLKRKNKTLNHLVWVGDE